MNKYRLAIKGIAISEGKSLNGIYYSAETLGKSYKSLSNKPIQKDHSNSVDATVGRLGETQFDGVSITYKGFLMDKTAIEMIKDGRISAVSIGASVGQILKKKDGSMEALGLTFHELSLVAIPGVPSASVEIEDYKKKSKLKERKDKKVIVEDYKTFISIDEHNRQQEAKRPVSSSDINNLKKQMSELTNAYPIKSKEIKEDKKQMEDKKTKEIFKGYKIEGNSLRKLNEDEKPDEEKSDSKVWEHYHLDETGFWMEK